MRTTGCIRLLTDIPSYLLIDRQDENERTNVQKGNDAMNASVVELSARDELVTSDEGGALKNDSGDEVRDDELLGTTDADPSPCLHNVTHFPPCPILEGVVVGKSNGSMFSLHWHVYSVQCVMIGGEVLATRWDSLQCVIPTDLR